MYGTRCRKLSAWWTAVLVRLITDLYIYYWNVWSIVVLLMFQSKWRVLTQLQLFVYCDTSLLTLSNDHNQAPEVLSCCSKEARVSNTFWHNGNNSQTLAECQLNIEVFCWKITSVFASLVYYNYVLIDNVCASLEMGTYCSKEIQNRGIFTWPYTYMWHHSDHSSSLSWCKPVGLCKPLSYRLCKSTVPQTCIKIPY
jgi:hypothetical protein